MTPHSCDQIRELMTGPMSDAQAISVEEHVEHCSGCQEHFYQPEFPPEQFTQRLRRGNAAIALPAARTAELLAATRDASNYDIPSRKRQLPRTTRFVFIAASLAACLILALGWWQFTRPANSSIGLVQETETSITRPSDRDNTPAVTTKKQEPASAPPNTAAVANTEPAATLFVRDGFMVADKETDDGEIPFFWVLPSSRQSVH